MKAMKFEYTQEYIVSIVSSLNQARKDIVY